MRRVSLRSAMLVIALSHQATAMSLDWNGLYRFEGVAIKNSELEDIKRDKSYLLHHMILRPKVVAADGLHIHARLDLFNDGNIPNSQLGEYMGNGPGTATPTSTESSNVLSQTQNDDSLLVTNLYLSLINEYGAFVAGRVPLQFGLGMTHNAGNGKFDHWMDTRDIVGYKAMFGNLMMMPMYAKVDEGELDIGDDVNEYMLHLDYNNDETENSFGFFYVSRVAGRAGNDVPGTIAGPGATFLEGYEAQLMNIYYLKNTDDFRFGFEAGFHKGKTGLVSTSSSKVEINALGLASELDWRPQNSSWQWHLRAGWATGDDPDSNSEFEGFSFDRNYDVGLLLFNHRLGQFDALGSALMRNTALNTGNPAVNFGNAGSQPDVESLGNVFYLAPGFTRVINEKWSWGGKLIYASLSQSQISIGGVSTKVESNLGTEVDVSLDYKPHERFIWSTQIGYLFSGAAFEGGTNSFDSKNSYGLFTKAAVSF